MKTIGLLGGMSWESSALYYRWINEMVNQRLGGLYSAKIAVLSVEFHEIEKLQREDRWDESAQILSQAATRIEAAGADFLLICTNTMHKVASQVEAAIHIPLLHIADATAEAIQAAGIRKVGLLGTRFTMEQDFYTGRLIDKYGLEVLVPPEADRQIVHRIIYEELVLGIVKEESRREYLRIMGDLRARGAEAIIEGCTEIVMLVQPEHTDIRLFDTTRIHAEKAVEMALAS
jgi:aspartate racemase